MEIAFSGNFIYFQWTRFFFPILCQSFSIEKSDWMFHGFHFKPINVICPSEFDWTVYTEFDVSFCVCSCARVCFSAATCVRLWLCPIFLSFVLCFIRISLCLYDCAQTSAILVYIWCAQLLRILRSPSLQVQTYAFTICSTNLIFFYFSYSDSYTWYTFSFGFSLRSYTHTFKCSVVFSITVNTVLTTK